jgi:diketogulonate reductase-like aldo/keto reductase
METIFLSCPEKVKAIGISNFSTHDLEKLLNIAKVVLAVNQVELHPSLPQEKLAKYCREKVIQLVAHSPLGSPDSQLLSERGICEIAERYRKSNVQVFISWGVGNGWGVLPKSVSGTSVFVLRKGKEMSYVKVDFAEQDRE